MKNLNVETKENNTTEELLKVHKKECFNIVENNAGDAPVFTITMGMYKIKEFTTLEEATEYIDAKPYELLFAMIGIAIEISMKELNNNTKN